MRKSLRFWQKTYLVTLLVFVVALNGGFALAGLRCYDVLLQGEVEQALSDQRMIARNLERDMAVALESGSERRAYEVAFIYDMQFADKGKDLLDVALSEDDEGRVYLSSRYGLQNPRLYVEPGEQKWQRVRFAWGEEFIIVGGGLDEGSGTLFVTWAHSLTDLEMTWRDIVGQLVLISCVATVLGSIGFLFALRSLARPLDALARTTNEYAAGDTTVRAPVHSNDEIGLLAASFNNLADTVDARVNDLREVADSNARMAASLSHEIRTPLTAIRGYAEYLQLAHVAPEEECKTLASIIHESNRLHGVSQRMLQLFALDNVAPALEPLSLGSVAAKAAIAAEQRATEHDVRLSFEDATEASCVQGFILGDPVLLESLIINLVDNAVNASGAGMCVQVIVRMSDACELAPGVEKLIEEDEHPVRPDTILLQVKDSGCGLAPCEIERLGEPFYRPDKARSRASGGAGLGLSLVQRIVQLHDAAIHFDSVEGEGTCVTVVFPLANTVRSPEGDSFEDDSREEGQTHEHTR